MKSKQLGIAGGIALCAICVLMEAVGPYKNSRNQSRENIGRGSHNLVTESPLQFATPGSWIFEDLPWETRIEDCSNSTLSSQITAPLHGWEHPSELSLANCELLSSLAGNSRLLWQHEDRSIMGLDTGTVRLRVFLRSTSQGDRIVIGATVAYPQVEGRSNVISAAPQLASRAFSKDEQLLPKVPGSKAIARRVYESGATQSAIYQQPMSAELVVNNWRQSGWEIQDDNWLADCGKLVLCEKDGAVISAAFLASEDPASSVVVCTRLQ